MLINKFSYFNKLPITDMGYQWDIRLQLKLQKKNSNMD